MKQHICDRPNCGEVIQPDELSPIELVVRVTGHQRFARLELCIQHRVELWEAIGVFDPSTKENA